MSLKQTILSDLTAAMKAREAETLSVLRMIKAALLNREKEAAGSELADDEITKILNTLVKQRRDSVAHYEQAGRNDLAAKEQAEIGIIEKYLPQAASDEEIAAAVEAALQETNAASPKDMGVAMKATLAKLAGKTVDGKVVSAAVRARLGA